MPKQKPLYPVKAPRQIAALASAVRQEVVDGLQSMGPCSIAELAASLGRAPDSLYYHVRALLRVGLVVQRGTQGDGRRATAIFDTPGRLVLDHEPASTTEKASLLRLVASALRLAERDLRAAFASGLAKYRRGARRNAWGARVKGWLTRDELAQVRDHLEAISTILESGGKRRGSSLHAVTFVLTPLAPSNRSRAASDLKRKDP